MMKSFFLPLGLVLSLAAGVAMAANAEFPVPGCNASRWVGEKISLQELGLLSSEMEEANTRKISGRLLARRASKLANGWFSIGRLKKGEPFFDIVLQNWEKSGAKPDVNIAQSLSYMADVAYCRKEVAKAGQLYLRAVDAWDKLFLPGIDIVMYQLSIDYREQLAVPWRERRISAMRSLAGFYYQEGRFAEGEAMFARSNAAVIGHEGKREAGESHWVNPKMLEKYRAGDAAAALALAQSDVQTAEKNMRLQQQEVDHQHAEFKARYQVGQAKPGPDEPSAEAERQKSAALKALHAVRRELNNRKGTLAMALNAQGELHHARQQLTEAEDLYLRSRSLMAETGRGQNIEYGRILSDLGLLYRARGENDKALSFQTQALELLLPILGAEHPDVIECQAELAFLRDQPALVKPAIKQEGR